MSTYPLRARRTFGTTDAKMNLFLEAWSFSMGEEGGSGGEFSVEVRATVHATVPGLELVLVRDGEEVQRWTTEESELDIAWTDSDPLAGTRYLYLRAEQSDGYIGWTSPV